MFHIGFYTFTIKYTFIHLSATKIEKSTAGLELEKQSALDPFQNSYLLSGKWVFPELCSIKPLYFLFIRDSDSL